MTTPAPRKKLIEVALPLEAINAASAREKSIRHGHPSTLHLWWARRPLAAARAVIFASLVDDPDDPNALPAFVEACKRLSKGPNATANDTPRMRLFDFIEALVQWESTTDEQVMGKARELIRIATEGNPPPLLDPFAGGGSIPLEAQRLGLEAHASDLNPVAVMINKAQIEIPPRFANQAPVNPRDRAAGPGKGATWRGATGLAADVRYYGEWMREQAFKKIGHLYPDLDGKTPIAWFWIRTVKCPNPACGATMPLASSFEISTKTGHRAWVEPEIDAESKIVSFQMKTGEGKAPPSLKLGRGVQFRCVVCGQPASEEYIKSEGRAKRMGAQMTGMVVEGIRGREYVSASPEQIKIAVGAQPQWQPDASMSTHPQYMAPPRYGMNVFSDLFTPRQLVALTTLSDLVGEAVEQARIDSLNATSRNGMRGGFDARDYANSIGVYLGLCVDRQANSLSALSFWNPMRENIQSFFSRQAYTMNWAYAEGNPFSGATGSFDGMVDYLANVLERLPAMGNATSKQEDAVEGLFPMGALFSTDPPYYDNVPYADLADYFYVWLRRSLRPIYPTEFGTVLTPKANELVADNQRFGGHEAANAHFQGGLEKVFTKMRSAASAYPTTVYYAFRQSVEDDGKDQPAQVSNIGWETMLASLIRAGFTIDGTWPMRTEQAITIKKNLNALASSIVLVCRPRPEDAPVVTRRQFLDALRTELPPALKALQTGSIAPVDLAQASIGPGMAVFSRASKVIEADGSPMSVRTALGLINAALDAYLAEQEGDLDPDSRFAVAWFEERGFNEGEFGRADVLARAKNTSVQGVAEAGVVKAGAGKVRLIHWKEYDPGDYDPGKDKRPTVWEAVHHLIERLSNHGEEGAALLRAKLSDEMAGSAKELAYRLYSICERKGWAEHARDYNALVVSLTAISDRATELQQNRTAGERTQQGRLFD